MVLARNDTWGEPFFVYPQALAYVSMRTLKSATSGLDLSGQTT